MLASAPVGVLARYLLVRFIVLFAAVLAILVVLVGVVELLSDFGDFVREGISFSDALAVVALRIPHKHLPLLIPIASFSAAFLAVGGAARNNEVIAMKAGGVSPLRVLIPVLACAVGIPGAALPVTHTLRVRVREG